MKNACGDARMRPWRFEWEVGSDWRLSDGESVDWLRVLYARGAEMMVRMRDEAQMIVPPTSIRRSVGPGEPIPDIDTTAESVRTLREARAGGFKQEER